MAIPARKPARDDVGIKDEKGQKGRGRVQRNAHLDFVASLDQIFHVGDENGMMDAR